MSGLLSDAELHGLIDGQIEVQHRADILRRAAASSDDRARISSWQTQCELIRSAFCGVDREPLPTALDLRAPARLHAVPAIHAVGHVDGAPPIIVAEGRRSRWALPLATLAIAAAGLAATWSAGGFSLAMPPVTASDGGPRAVAEVTPGAATLQATAAPATTIPDLSSLGYTLVAADVRLGPPPSIEFRYRNADAGQLTLAVSRTGKDATAATVGGALVWHVGSHSYALAGNLRPDAMRTLAPAVRALALDE